MKRAAPAAESPSKRARRKTALVRGQIGFDTESDDEVLPSKLTRMLFDSDDGARGAAHATSPRRLNPRPWAHSGAEVGWDDTAVPDIPSKVAMWAPALDTSTPVFNAFMDDATGEFEDSAFLDPLPETFGPNSVKPIRHQGQSHRISKILKITPDIQSRILATFAHPQLGHPCSCGEPVAYRCVDCFNAPMWCRACIVREHQYSPFHHIERWDGKMFVRDALATTRPFDKTKYPVEDLSDIHLLVQTHPHPDAHQPRCPHRRPGDPDIGQFTIGDHNGFHTAWIEFCQCLRPGDDARWQQLLAVRLFPATFEQPQTAFMFTAMKQFHVHVLASKKSAYDYVKAVCQLNNNAAPTTVADRYREFLFACRIWRYLTLQRRTGQAHGIDELVPHRHAASLAVRCPACPEVSFNMSCEEMANATKEERHKYTLFLSTDGDFKLQRKKKREDPDDFALNDGNTYFPPNEDFKAYGELIKEEKQEEALQYGVHLLVRFARWFPSMTDIIEKLTGAINKLHILSHKELCQIIHNLNWLLYVGMVSMEMIETGWAEHNLTAGSMREMNDGHRHDVIDETSDHWNWEKTIKLPEALTRLYRTAKSEQRTRTASFESLDKFQKDRRPEAVARWETQNENPRRDRDGVWHSVFQLNLKSGPPTHVGAYAKLLAQEATAQQSADSRVAGGKTRGYRERIKRMRASPTTPADVLAAARQQLESDIKALRKWQLNRVPELHRYMSEMDGGKPEKMRLLLPSDFSPADRVRLQLSGLAKAEYRLQEGQAHDVLGDLRMAIRTKNFNLNLKKTDIYGTGATMRAGNYLKGLQNQVQGSGDTYRRSWRGLRALGLPKGDATLQPLSRDEQWGKGGVALKATRLKDREPWFWSAQRPAGLDAKAEADWEEMDRVQWFRERALMKRANEEVEILEAEFARSRRWFLRNSENWTKMAEREKRGDYVDNQGWRAYAHKQAIIYAALARECEMLWKKLPQLVVDDEIAEAKKAKKDEEEREVDAMEEPDYEAIQSRGGQIRLIPPTPD
ncbi:hypothetical protein K438DRAFT_1765569 [Mycena galopus ATCC 62051]|nr:hypothetical protein K438DRAFT_1765569 [Mycena galopus ATCC 62051]